MLMRSAPRVDVASTNETAEDNSVEGLVVKLHTLFERISESFRATFP